VRPGRFGVRAAPAAALVAAALTASSGQPAHAQGTPLLPDLVADAATNPTTAVFSDASGTRWLLRFDGYVHNRGQGALELTGSSPVGDEMSAVTQRVYDSDGGYQDTEHVPAPRVLFEPADGHNHWHLRAAAGYSLWDQSRTRQLAPAQKVGFCLIDSTRIDPWARSAAYYTTAGNGFCQRNNPGATSVNMGVSAGWRDFYHRSLPYQWVDISDVQPGNYAVRSDVDPDGVIAEAGESNAPAFADAVVPGYLATAFSQQVGSVLPSTVTLRAQTFGSPGSRQFRIDTMPGHGSLGNLQKGTWYDGSSVTYTPSLLYKGPDSFAFSVRDKTNPFPRSPVSVTATLGVGMAPLSSRALSPGTTVTTSEPRRAPDVPDPLPADDGAAMSAPQVYALDGDLLVRTVAWRPGVVRLAVRGTGHACTSRVPAGVPFTCLLPRSAAGTGAEVVATLQSAGKLLASREVRLR
jgi:hypothetical protein